MEIIIKDQATAVLDAIGAKRNQYKQVAEAMGLALVSLAIRSFNEESLRAAPWASAKPPPSRKTISCAPSPPANSPRSPPSRIPTRSSPA